MPKNKSIKEPVVSSVPEGISDNTSIPGTSEERRAKLESDFEGLENRERKLNSQSLLNKNKLQEIKSSMIRAMFQILENAGVDPSNIESIRNFLQQLEQKDPDLAAIFEFAFNGLTRNEELQSPGVPLGPEQGLPIGQAVNPASPGAAIPAPELPPSPSVTGLPGASIDQPREIPFNRPQ